MYLGEHSVKNKNNKFILPKKLRQGSDNLKLIVESKTEDEELANLVPERSFEEFAKKIVIKSVFNLEINEKYEIKLPNDQLFDQLGQTIILLGLGNFIEIWMPEKWEKYQKKITPEKINQILEELEKK